MKLNPATPDRAPGACPSTPAENEAGSGLPRFRIRFYSYFKDLTGCAETILELPPGSSVAALISELEARFPKLIPMRRSTLVAVGVDYQGREYVLREGDEVSLFPPVQGG